MVAFPAVSALISLVCAVFIARDTLRRPRPDKTAWAIAFALFAVAAGAEVVGSQAGWDETLVRVYYLAGAVLVVGFLALGQLYLLAGPRIGRIAPGASLLVTALAATVVWGAPIDEGRVAADGWDAIERTPALTALAITINSVGTLVIVGGLVYSAARFRRLGVQRNRMIGCLLIAAGTLTVASGGTLTRLGAHEYLYIAMSAGVGIIFAGYLWTRRPEGTSAPAAGEVDRQLATQAVAQPAGRAPGTIHRPAPALGLVGEPPVADGSSRAVAFVAELLTRDDVALGEACRVWSVPAREVDAFTRTEARRVWAMRGRLPETLLPSFDARPPALRLQLAELYLDVLSADGRPPIPVAVAAADSPSAPSAVAGGSSRD